MFKLIKQYITIFLFSICYIGSWPLSAAQDNKQSQQQLNDIKKAIASEKEHIINVTKERKTLELQLQKNDIAIAKIAKALNSTTQSLSTTQQQLKQLQIKKQSLTIAKNKQENLLAKQLQTAYTSGNHDYLKLLLNQENPTNVQRSITYYQYLNDARILEIEQFKTTISKLLEVVSLHQEKSEELTQLKAQQTAQKNNLKQSSLLRNKTITQLKKQLLTSKQQLEKLQNDEENLQQELERIKKLAKRSLKLTGLKNLKGQLNWPIKGRLKHRFGTRKQGYLKWKGVLLSAPVGKTIHSIYNGKVLFSDWLKGYGLVSIIDHGNGYMSLYGHNQTLLKSVGDSVEAGEPIALAGQSGGNEQSGLYFEIRHNGQAVNPKIWCR